MLLDGARAVCASSDPALLSRPQFRTTPKAALLREVERSFADTPVTTGNLRPQSGTQSTPSALGVSLCSGTAGGDVEGTKNEFTELNWSAHKAALLRGVERSFADTPVTTGNLRPQSGTQSTPSALGVSLCSGTAGGRRGTKKRAFIRRACNWYWR